MTTGVQLWIESYLPPSGESPRDEHISLRIAIALDLDWAPAEEAIENVKPAELVARVSNHFLGDRAALAYEIR